MNKIRIEDLSVGDWVQDKNGTIAQIIGIENWSDGYVLNVRINGIDVGCVSAKAIEPIPITPEILERNGFKKNGEYDEWNIGTWRTPYLLGVSLERPAITIKWNGSSVFIDQAKYIHQLQHALRLAGVEKEIELWQTTN